MRVFWEKVGVLGPLYRLVGQGSSDREIAAKLNLPEPSVQACIAWILRFLRSTERNELIGHATAPAAVCTSHQFEATSSAATQLLL
jgi:hypothetical protein